MRRLGRCILLLLPLFVGCRAWDRFSFEGTDSGGVDAGGVDSGGVDSGGVDSGGLDSGGVDSGGVDSGGVDSGGTDAPLPVAFCDSYPGAMVCEDFERGSSWDLLEAGGTCAIEALGANHAMVCVANSGEAASVQFPYDDAPSIHARFRLRALERAATGYFEGVYAFDLQPASGLVAALGHQPGQVLLSAFDRFDSEPTDFAAEGTCVEVHVESVADLRSVEMIVSNGAGMRSTLSLAADAPVSVAPSFIMKLGVPFNADAGRVRVAIDDVVISTSRVTCD